jgi:hypothetical protein
MWLVDRSLDEIAGALDELLAQWLRSDEPVSLEPSSDDDAVCFWVDPVDGASREWRPLARHRGLLLPRFDPDLVACPVGAA